MINLTNQGAFTTQIEALTGCNMGGKKRDAKEMAEKENLIDTEPFIYNLSLY